MSVVSQALKWQEVGDDLYEAESKGGGCIVQVYPAYKVFISNRGLEMVDESSTTFFSFEEAKDEGLALLSKLLPNSSVGPFESSTPFRMRAEVITTNVVDENTPKWVSIDKMWVGDVTGGAQQLFNDCYDAMLWCEEEVYGG